MKPYQNYTLLARSPRGSRWTRSVCPQNRLVARALVVCVTLVAITTASAVNIDWNVANGDFFDSANWNSSSVPALGDDAFIANGGTATGNAPDGPVEATNLFVGDIVNGGDGTFQLDGIDLNISRDLNVAGSAVPSTGNAASVGMASIINPTAVQIGNFVRVGSAEFNSDQTINADAALTIEGTAGVTAVNFGSHFLVGNAALTEGGSGSTSSIVKGAASLRDLDTLTINRAPHVGIATLTADTDAPHVEGTGELTIDNVTTEVSMDRLDVGIALSNSNATGTATANGVITITDVTSLRIGDELTVGSSRAERPGIDGVNSTDIVANGSLTVINVAAMQSGDSWDIGVARVTGSSGVGDNPIVNGSSTADGQVTLINTNARSGRIEVGTASSSTSEGQLTATVDANGTLTLIDSSLDVGGSRGLLIGTALVTGIANPDSQRAVGLVELDQSFANMRQLQLGDGSDDFADDGGTLLFHLDGTTRATLGTAGDPGIYSAIDAIDAMLEGTIVADFDFVPTAGTHHFDLLTTADLTALDDTTASFLVQDLNPGFTVDFFGVVEDNVDIVRLTISGTPVDVTAVPEPASAGLVVLGAGLLMRRR